MTQYGSAIQSLVCALLLFLPVSLVAQGGRGNQGSSTRPLEVKARAAMSGDDNAIRELASQIFELIGDISAPTVAPIMESFLERLTRAEKSFRTGGSGAVTDDRVAATVNALARKLSAPDYATTTLDQVQTLRTAAQRIFPTFMGRVIDAGTEQQSKKTQVSYALSPLQATYLGILLVNQKLNNPEFQLTPEEWTQQRRARLDAMAAARTGSERNTFRNQILSAYTAQSARNLKRKQLMELIKNFASAESTAELQAMGHEVLDELGVER